MKKLIFILITLLSVGASAQKTDSLYFYAQSAANIPFIHANAAFLLSDTTNRLGLATGDFRLATGGFKVAQQAEHTAVARIYAEGLNRFLKFKTSGYFAFSRTWQDSLAWSTKGMEADDQPYYYASKKAGKFERLNYHLGGILSYQLLKDKLYLASGISFQYNSTTRSVDPRPEVNTFQLIVKPEMVYKLNHHLFSLTGKFGYGEEAISLDYKNTDYKLSLGYPDRINYLIQGYGLIAIYQGSNNFKRNLNYRGLGLNYSHNSKAGQLKIALNYNQNEEKNYNRLSASVNRAYFGLYKISEIDLQSSLSKRKDRTSSLFTFSYLHKNNHDNNIMLNAINYRYKSEALALRYYYQLLNKKTLPEFGIQLLFNEVNKKDLSTDHFIDFSWIEPALSFMQYRSLNKDNRIAYGLNAGYRYPLTHHIDVPVTQQSVFTNGVVFPDFTYYSSEAFKFGGTVHYLSSHLIHTYKTGVALNFQHYSQTKQGHAFNTATSAVGKQFTEVKIGLNLYF